MPTLPLISNPLPSPPTPETMHPHTLRNRRILALLAAPATAEEARRLLAAANQRMQEIDAHPRPRRSFLRAAAKAGDAAAAAAEGTAALLAADLFSGDTPALLRFEAGQVRAMAAHLRHQALHAVEGY